MSFREIGMSKEGKSDANKTSDSRVRNSVPDAETFGEALSEVEFVPANVGPKTVSQGKYRETLKRWLLRSQASRISATNLLSLR